MLGNLDTHESIARYYCAHAGAAVISVDYRLAPEHRFPTHEEYSYAALAWVSEHARELGVDRARVAVTGDSAGGNLATVMCLLANARRGPRIACQALLYPGTDFRPGQSYASYAEFGDGSYFLSSKDMAWFRSSVPRRRRVPGIRSDRIADGRNRPQRFAPRAGNDGGLRSSARRGARTPTA